MSYEYTISRLESLKSLEKGWYNLGEEGEAITEAASNAATKLYNIMKSRYGLSSFEGFQFSPFPTVEGGIFIEPDNDLNNYWTCVEIYPDGKVYYWWHDCNTDKCMDGTFDNIDDPVLISYMDKCINYLRSGNMI